MRYSGLVHRPMPGIHPGGRPSFLRAQEGRQRRRSRSVAPSLREGIPCDARNPRPAQDSLRSLRTVRSDSCAESVDEAGFARVSGTCASRRLERGTPQQPTAKPAGRPAAAVRHAPFSTAEKRKALRACAQRASRTDSVRLSERSVAEGTPHGPSRPEHRREPAAKRRAVRSSGAFCLLFGGPKRRSPAGAKSRHHTLHKASATRQALQAPNT